jgi:60 kDa SS-A/Ro ribonucleoprotein
MRTNTKPVEPRTAGGYGPVAADQSAIQRLRRVVLANLLWEKPFYDDGQAAVTQIERLVPLVPAPMVAQVAWEARNVQKLRHVGLKVAVEMAKTGGEHRRLLGDLLPQIIQRPDELSEFLSLYWQQPAPAGKRHAPLATQVKKGLGKAFGNFDAYQLAKWDRQAPVRLRDVLFLVHADPGSLAHNTKLDRQAGLYDQSPRGVLYRQLVEGTLPTPDTWEVELSAHGNNAASWTRLIAAGKLPALAFLRNLRNMLQAEVPYSVISAGLRQLNPRWLLPVNYIAAAETAPVLRSDIEALMLRGFEGKPKLPGMTDFVVDVSGSMGRLVSAKSQFSRMQVAAAMAVLAREQCERVRIWVTAGDDFARKHKTEQLKLTGDVNEPIRGFALSDRVIRASGWMGGGGIFTRQCLEHMKSTVGSTDRIVIFSDSQDCDFPRANKPAPFGRTNYIVDVSSERYGINYEGVWTAEISGWSEGFLSYIMAMEGLEAPEREEDSDG